MTNETLLKKIKGAIESSFINDANQKALQKSRKFIAKNNKDYDKNYKEHFSKYISTETLSFCVCLMEGRIKEQIRDGYDFGNSTTFRKYFAELQIEMNFRNAENSKIIDQVFS